MVEETIRVILTGICTFVGAGVGNNGRPLTAVFANATHHQPEHHVSLIVPTDDYVVDVDRRWPPRWEYSEMGTPYRIVLLDGRALPSVGCWVTARAKRPSAQRRSKRLHRPATVTDLKSVSGPIVGRSWRECFPFVPHGGCISFLQPDGRSAARSA